MKIYTKSGDKGMTGLHGGERTSKDDIRIEANGCLDSLNSLIGLIRAMMAEDDDRQPLYHMIQKGLMVVMSHVATPEGIINPNELHASELTLRLEHEMDRMTSNLCDNGYFLLPGGTILSAYMHLARTSSREAERRLWTVNKQYPVDTEILKLINRLSDFFFVSARMEMQNQNWPEEKWQHFAYKRRKKHE